MDIKRLPAALAIGLGIIWRRPQFSLADIGVRPQTGPGWVYPGRRSSSVRRAKRAKAKRKGVQLHRLHMKRRSG